MRGLVNARGDAEAQDDPVAIAMVAACSGGQVRHDLIECGPEEIDGLERDERWRGLHEVVQIKDGLKQFLLILLGEVLGKAVRLVVAADDAHGDHYIVDGVEVAGIAAEELVESPQNAARNLSPIWVSLCREHGRIDRLVGRPSRTRVGKQQ